MANLILVYRIINTNRPLSIMQRDPGEYLLELQRFAAITDAHLRGHAIDLHLRRYDGAVRHLLAAADDHFPDALALARQHGLLRLVISLTKDRPALHAHAHIAAGEDLENAGRHEDAALAFSAAGDLERALRAYRLAGQWRPALALAARLGREPDKIQAMAARMAVDLADGQRQAEAAAVILEYLDDVPGAVALLAEAGEWRECVRVAYARGRGDLVDTTIAPAAAAASVRILESVSDDVARVEKYWSRLKEIRHRRETMAAVVEASEAEEREALRPFGGMDDAASEVESMVSGLSAYTMGTAVGTATIGGSGASSVSVWTVGGRKKDKRKDKGKKGKSSRKIRHGSPEEEAQLALHVLSLSPLPELCAEVGQLTELLVMLGHAADAELLQRKLKLLIDSQAEAARDVVNNPSPGQGLVIPDAAKRMALAAAGLAGPAAMRALETAARAVAGPEVQRRAAEAEAALRGVHWKWEVLRDP